MKEEEFNKMIKNAIEDYESKSVVHFNRQKVWSNTQRKTNKKRGFWFVAASLLITFLSVAVWINSSIKSQDNTELSSIKPQNKEDNKTVKTDNPKTDNEEKTTIKPLQNDLIIKKTVLAKADLIEGKIAEPRIEFPQDSIIKIAEVVPPKPQKPVEELFTTEFKRGKTPNIIEAKSETIVVSFKKHQPKDIIVIESATAQVKPKNNIYKLKF